MNKKRYAIVGTGSRSFMYMNAIINEYNLYGEIVGLCDKNKGRLEFYHKKITDLTGISVAAYSDEHFDRMIVELKPDTVIVTTGPDCTHDAYIIRAMESGCDVITEKPLTVNESKCRDILTTVKKTGRNCRVTFNYRYSPPRSQVKEIIQSGQIGEVLSIDFTWFLDTCHGADYFRRWHRKLDNSGSLLVHKATHHFDLVNWWIGDRPEEVFCFGTKRYYTPERAERLGLKPRSERCCDCPSKGKCNFYIDLGQGDLKSLYRDNEKYDGYFRDSCVFSEEIDIWDTMTVNVRYKKGALLSYILHAYSPVEGYSITFNGTSGRLEHRTCENTYISGDDTIPGELEIDATSITLIPEFCGPMTIAPWVGEGGHGGGDPILLRDIFDPYPPEDPLRRKADHIDGAYSILVGVAAYRSIQTGNPVKISKLLGDIL
ncbi:MAG: Gfo/Idh/MocA family oxidoreductase [Spirochaetota bacterium]